MSFSIAACVFLAISLAFPFLAFSSSGVESVMTLPEASLTIYRERDPLLAAIVFVTIIGAPGMLLFAILALTTPLILRKKASWLKGIGKFVFLMAEWNMVEVFIIGTIVSLVKIAKLATVTLGLSFWAYIIFTICLVAALSGLDRHEVWQKIEEYTP
jgi:paraquat-inducible protein A